MTSFCSWGSGCWTAYCGSCCRKKLVQIKGKIGRHIQLVTFGQFQIFVLEVHHTVFPRDILPVAVVNLIEGIPGITDIAKLGKLAAFLQCHIPAVGGFDWIGFDSSVLDKSVLDG